MSLALAFPLVDGMGVTHGISLSMLDHMGI